MGSYVVVTSGRAKDATVRALKRLSPRAVGSKILIKPNLASRVRDRGENTDVRVVEGIVEYFHDKGDITIAEGCCGSVGSVPKSTHRLFKFAGYSRLEDRYGLRLCDLNAEAFEKVKCYDKMLGVAKTALETDYLVTVPVLKTHEFTTISACVKNLMGCLEPKPAQGHETATKWEIHAELSETDLSQDPSGYRLALNKFERRLVDLYRRLSPRLGIVDAVTASEGDAPIHGTPVHMGLVLASENPISCDAVAAHLMGIDPATIGHLRLAKNRDLGEIDIKEIKTNADLRRYRTKFMLPSSIIHLREKSSLPSTSQYA
jgi:uncharacterized protein (DUF362 family)